MRRSLALLLLTVALLLQAAAPALAALSSDCSCAKAGACDTNTLPCTDSAAGCHTGPCARSPATFAATSNLDLALRQVWAASLSTRLTPHPPDSDLRPPIS
jgi:hypothetical protein